MLSDGDCHRPARNRRLRVLLILLISLFLIVGLTGCNALEDAVERAAPLIPKGYKVVHIEQVSNNSGIVFYTYQQDISTGIFTRNRLGWDWIGSSVGRLVTFPEGLQWRYADLEDRSGKASYSVYYGKITNKNIEKVTVTTINGKVFTGQIVEVDDLKLWYAFVDEPQVPSVNAEIVGYANNNLVLYHFTQPRQ